MQQDRRSPKTRETSSPNVEFEFKRNVNLVACVLNEDDWYSIESDALRHDRFAGSRSAVPKPRYPRRSAYSTYKRLPGPTQQQKPDGRVSSTEYLRPGQYVALGVYCISGKIADFAPHMVSCKAAVMVSTRNGNQCGRRVDGVLSFKQRLQLSHLAYLQSQGDQAQTTTSWFSYFTEETMKRYLCSFLPPPSR